MALAHLLAVSAGNPITVPAGLLEETFGRALDVLIPAGTTPQRMALAGPELPAPDADILLVPLHPQTGRAWQPSAPATTVPLDADGWIYLAFHEGRSMVPATDGLPGDVLRDDPLPMRPSSRFDPDAVVFHHTLARLPAVRQPWLSAIFDQGQTKGALVAAALAVRLQHSAPDGPACPADHAGEQLAR
jgi:hypothetical protein